MGVGVSVSGKKNEVSTAWVRGGQKGEKKMVEKRIVGWDIEGKKIEH